MKIRATATTLIVALGLVSGCDGGTVTGNGAATTAQKPTTPIALKKAGIASGLEFTVTKVEQRGQLGMASAGMKAGPTETYVIIHYTLKNTGAAPITFMEFPGLSLLDPKGQSYANDVSAAAMAANGLDEMTGMATDLNPNVSARGVGVWKVDRAAFSKATWALVVASEPNLTFALK